MSVRLGVCGLVKYSPEETNPITVQKGDVVGYYTFSRRSPQDSKGDGIQLDPNYISDIVWYHTNIGSHPLTMGEPDCPFPVGTEAGRILTSSTNAGLVFSVDICK